MTMGSSDHHQRVVVTGVRIPFWDMVVLLVTLAVAAIPAMVLLAMAAGAVWMFVLSLVI